VIERPKLFELYKRRLFINVKRDYSACFNEYDSRMWEYYDICSLVLGFDPGKWLTTKLFEKESFEFDGHTYDVVKIFGVVLGVATGYECQLLETPT